MSKKFDKEDYSIDIRKKQDEESTLLDLLKENIE